MNTYIMFLVENKEQNIWTSFYISVSFKISIAYMEWYIYSQATFVKKNVIS